MKKSFALLLVIINIIFSQNLNFVIVDEIDTRTNDGKENLVKISNSLNQLKDLDFVVFNNFTADLNNPDASVQRTIKKINHPLFLLPGTSDFFMDKSAREKFLNNYGDLNFRKNVGSVKVIGLNSTVAWDDESYFERETLNFLKNQKLDSLTNSILILNDTPERIKNFDEIAELFNGSQIKLIIAPFGKTKEFFKDDFSFLNTSIDSRKDETFLVVHISDDTLIVNTASSEGKFGKENNYVLKSNEFNIVNETNPLPGNIKWKFDLGYSLSADLITQNGDIFAADVSGQVVCLDSRGRKKWEYFSFGYIYSTPTVMDGYLAIATVQGDIETIDIRNGKAIQSLGFDSPITSDLLSFEFTGPYNLMIPKQTKSKAAVVAGTESGKLYCYDLETLQELWRFDKPKNAIIQKPIYVKGQIIFYSLDGSIYCVNAQTGLLTWSSKLKEKNENLVYASDLVANGNDVFISLLNGKIFSYDILLGKQNWEYDKYKLSTTLGISNDGRHIYAKSINDRIHILSANNGTWVKEVLTNFGNDNSETEIIELDNKIYLGLESGYLIQLDNKFNPDKLVKIDNTPLYSIVKVDEQNLAVAYHDGTISLIKVKE